MSPLQPSLWPAQAPPPSGRRSPVRVFRRYVFHTMLILLMLLSAVVSGARVYSYYMLDVYEEKLREQMATRKPDTELV